MGLSTKQVSNDDGFDWSQSLLQDQRLLPAKKQLHQRQQSQNQSSTSEQVKCPRCDSTNTKFCYFNNYNKSQPRHFCKACKRHWTKGGTLRNVPVGGGRKNKRPKKSPPSTGASTTAPTAATNDTSVVKDVIFQKKGGVLASDQIQQQPLVCTQSSLFRPSFMNCNELDSENFCSNTTTNEFRGASLDIPQDLNVQFHLPCSSPFEISPWQHPMLTGTTTMPTTTLGTTWNQPWNLSSSCLETVSNNWNWDEFDKLVSGSLNLPWDDLDIKP